MPENLSTEAIVKPVGKLSLRVIKDSKNTGKKRGQKSLKDDPVQDIKSTEPKVALQRFRKSLGEFYYKTDNGSAYNDDRNNVLKRLPDNSIDLVLTTPS